MMFNKHLVEVLICVSYKSFLLLLDLTERKGGRKKGEREREKQQSFAFPMLPSGE